MTLAHDLFCFFYCVLYGTTWAAFLLSGTRWAMALGSLFFASVAFSGVWISRLERRRRVHLRAILDPWADVDMTARCIATARRVGGA
jgi:hypothetical protein